MKQNSDDLLTDALAQRVRQLREGAAWSTRKAADEAGISQTKWVRLESGRSDPKLHTLVRVQKAFGLATIEALLGDLPSVRLQP